MFAKPQQEHQFLDQLVGQWNLEHDCQMPDGSKSTTHGTMTCRSLGGMWLICESCGESLAAKLETFPKTMSIFAIVVRLFTNRYSTAPQFRRD